MNYAYQYFKIITRRVERPASLDSDYVEIHHIIPKSEGGSDDTSNLVELTAREHYVCHLLLAKIYDDFKMHSAVCYMKHSRTGLKVNSRLYEALKRRWSQLLTQQRKGKYHWYNNGETQIVGSSCPEGFVEGMIPGKNNYKRKMSEESKRKNSISHIGKKHTVEARAKISKALKGRKISEEQRKKQSIARKGKPNYKLRGRHISEEHKQKMSEKMRVYKRIKVTLRNGEVHYFDSVRDVAKALNCFRNQIYKYMKHGKTWYGIKFEAER